MGWGGLGWVGVAIWFVGWGGFACGFRLFVGLVRHRFAVWVLSGVVSAGLFVVRGCWCWVVWAYCLRVLAFCGVGII